MQNDDVSKGTLNRFICVILAQAGIQQYQGTNPALRQDDVLIRGP